MAKYCIFLFLFALTTGVVAQNPGPGRTVTAVVRPDNTQKPVIWRVRERVLRAGEKVDMNFLAFGFTDVAAFQFALKFNPAILHFDSIQVLDSTIGLDPSGNFGLFNIAGGEIRSLWSAPQGQTLPAGTPLFRINFTALSGGKKLSEVINLDDTILYPVAYNTVLASRDLQLYFADYTRPFDPRSAVGEMPALSLEQNYPNPFDGCTTIGFTVPGETNRVTLRVFDGLGRQVWAESGIYSGGYQEMRVCLDGHVAPGVCFYRLETPAGVLVRRMDFIRN